MSAVRRLRRGLSWSRFLLGLIAADAAFLLHVSTEARRAGELERLVEVGTPEAITEAMALAPERRPWLLYNLGSVYLDDGTRRRFAGSLRAALGYYREALRIHPDLLEAKRNYEVAWRRLESLIPPRPPREPRPPDRVAPSQMPLLPGDI